MWMCVRRSRFQHSGSYFSCFYWVKSCAPSTMSLLSFISLYIPIYTHYNIKIIIFQFGSSFFVFISLNVFGSLFVLLSLSDIEFHLQFSIENRNVYTCGKKNRTKSNGIFVFFLRVLLLIFWISFPLFNGVYRFDRVFRIKFNRKYMFIRLPFFIFFYLVGCRQWHIW